MACLALAAHAGDAAGQRMLKLLTVRVRAEEVGISEAHAGGLAEHALWHDVVGMLCVAPIFMEVLHLQTHLAALPATWARLAIGTV